MAESAKNSANVAAKAAVIAARAILDVSEDIPYFGTAAKLINKLVGICDQLKCNKEAGQDLQVRFCRLANYLFDGPQGLAVVAQNRPNNLSLATFCKRMEDILHTGCEELKKYTKSGFMMKVFRGSKPQELFDGLDRDMTQCLNELAAVLSATLLTEQAQVYDVVCNIQASIDEHGGLQGLMDDRVQLQQLAVRIGADIDDLGSEIQSALDSLGVQVSAVDENVRGIMLVMQEVHHAVAEIQNSTSVKPPDLTALQLTHPPHVDRTRLLGVGAFGKVYKGTYSHTDVAVKEVTVIDTLSAAQLKELSREVLMHSKVANLPGVVRLFGANLTVEPRCIVLELADGSLHDALHKKTLAVDFTLPTKLSLAAQLCSTMAAVSAMNIIHRDIKSANVLLFLQSGRDRVLAKLSDFGLTKVVNESTMTHAGAATPKGTPPYMAPELFLGISAVLFLLILYVMTHYYIFCNRSTSIQQRV